MAVAYAATKKKYTKLSDNNGSIYDNSFIKPIKSGSSHIMLTALWFFFSKAFSVTLILMKFCAFVVNNKLSFYRHFLSVFFVCFIHCCMISLNIIAVLFKLLPLSSIVCYTFFSWMCASMFFMLGGPVLLLLCSVYPQWQQKMICH